MAKVLTNLLMNKSTIVLDEEVGIIDRNIGWQWNRQPEHLVRDAKGGLAAKRARKRVAIGVKLAIERDRHVGPYHGQVD